jgi:phage-related protein
MHILTDLLNLIVGLFVAILNLIKDMIDAVIAFLHGILGLLS